jgi:hypothetical protein
VEVEIGSQRSTLDTGAPESGWPKNNKGEGIQIEERQAKSLISY